MCDHNPAKAMFEWLGGDSGNLDKPRVPVWEDQPDHIKEVFIRNTQPGSRFYHYGRNQVFSTRNDSSYYIYTPMTSRDALSNSASIPHPMRPSEGLRNLRRIEVLEEELNTLTTRFEGKEEQRKERNRIKLEIYEVWRRISPTDVCIFNLKDIYEAHIDKSDNVRLPDWMIRKKADNS